MQENKRFNRRESGTDHHYFDQFGFRGMSDCHHEGLIKVKLAHGSAYSVAVPDVLLLGSEAQHWIQPLTFHPNLIHFLDADAECRLHVDISCGHTIAVRFRESDLVQRLDDGSELYRCTYSGPADMEMLATGRSRRTKDGRVWLELFHHTTPESKEAIVRSGHFRLSRWNVQGTKKLANVGYAYFTPLDQINVDADLKCIAMAADGNIRMLVDNVDPPPFMSSQIKRQLKGALLDLPVYRESTRNRTAVLPFWIDVAALAPQHIWRHSPLDQGVFYEIANPFVQRIGMPANAVLPFSNDEISATNSLKRFDYVVIGDARIVSGLAAPFDEEDTRHLLKLERAGSSSNLFRFWYEHANTDLFTTKPVELQEFEDK